MTQQYSLPFLSTPDDSDLVLPKLIQTYVECTELMLSWMLCMRKKAAGGVLLKNACARGNSFCQLIDFRYLKNRSLVWPPPPTTQDQLNDCPPPQHLTLSCHWKPPTLKSVVSNMLVWTPNLWRLRAYVHVSRSLPNTSTLSCNPLNSSSMTQVEKQMQNYKICQKS